MTLTDRISVNLSTVVGERGEYFFLAGYHLREDELGTAAAMVLVEPSEARVYHMEMTPQRSWD